MSLKQVDRYFFFQNIPIICKSWKLKRILVAFYTEIDCCILWLSNHDDEVCLIRIFTDLVFQLFLLFSKSIKTEKTMGTD